MTEQLKAQKRKVSILCQQGDYEFEKSKKALLVANRQLIKLESEQSDAESNLDLLMERAATYMQGSNVCPLRIQSIHNTIASKTNSIEAQKVLIEEANEHLEHCAKCHNKTKMQKDLLDQSRQKITKAISSNIESTTDQSLLEAFTNQSRRV